MDLKQKLARLKNTLPGGVMSAADLLKSQQTAAPQDLPDMTPFIPGEVHTCEAGTCFVSDEVFPFNSFVGAYPVERLRRLDPSALIDTFELSPPTQPDGPILFVDTETTGLAGGTGTYAFQVGVGWVEEEGFRVRQYFMRDYDEEPGQMALLGELFSKASLLVTYNGATFDIPLLRTRFVFNRVRLPIHEIPHLDLLPVARRLWKPRHGRANLSYIEEKVLESVREGDVPGSLIPTLYFQFTRGASPRTLVPVFYHNRMDIVALAALTERALSCHLDPASAEDEWERLGVARFHEKRGREELAAQILAPIERTPDVDSACWHLAARMQAQIHKRLGQFEQAARKWWDIYHHGPFDPVVYLELAKHLEHRVKDFDEARCVVEQIFEKYGVSPAPQELPIGSLFDEEEEFESSIRYDYSEGVRGWRDELPVRQVEEDCEPGAGSARVFTPPRLTAKFEQELNHRLARIQRKLHPR